MPTSIAVTSFETTNFVSNITSENNSFSIRIPGLWISKDGDELISNVNKVLELRCEIDMEIHVIEVENRGT